MRHLQESTQTSALIPYQHNTEGEPHACFEEASSSTQEDQLEELLIPCLPGLQC